MGAPSVGFTYAGGKMFPPDPPEAKLQSLEFPVNLFLFLKAEVEVPCLGQLSCTFFFSDGSSGHAGSSLPASRGSVPNQARQGHLEGNKAPLFPLVRELVSHIPGKSEVHLFSWML